MADDNKSEHGSGGLREMSVVQMNVLRAELGLPPLKTTSTDSAKDREKQEQEAQLREEETKRRQAIELEDKLRMLREVRAERERKKKMKQIGTLGDSDSDDEGGVATWISKSRQVQAERTLAKKREQLLAELEQDDEDETPAPKAKVDDRAIVAGIKVAHDVDHFVEGESHILTLADRPIISKGQVDDEVDELESAALVERSTLAQQKQVKSGKTKYDPYSYEQKQGMDESGNLSILPQYDEIENLKEREKEARRKKAFILSEEGVELTDAEKEATVKANLAKISESIGKVDGGYQVKFKSDFLTKDEIATFKKKRVKTNSSNGTEATGPKKKLRKKRKSLADELEPLPGEESESHLGSRQDRSQRQRDQQIQEVTAALEKRDNYKRAVSKAENDSTLLLDQHEEDESLFQSLARARELAKQQRTQREVEIAEQLEKQQQEQSSDTEERRSVPKKEVRLVFDSTSEFIKTIPTNAQAVEAEEPKKKIKEEHMEVDTPAEPEIKREEDVMEQEENLVLLKPVHGPKIKAESTDSAPRDTDENENENEEDSNVTDMRKRQKEREKKRKRGLTQDGVPYEENDQEDARDSLETEEPKKKKKRTSTENTENPDEPVEKVIGAEPLVSKGILSTLELLKTRGELEERQLIGRASDEILDPVNKDGDAVVLEYLDDFGRPMTTKEAYRRLSYKFHGKAPSKNKIEKRTEREMKDVKRNKVATTEVPLSTLAAVKKTTEETHTPFVVVGASVKPVIANLNPATLMAEASQSKKGKNKKQKQKQSKSKNNNSNTITLPTPGSPTSSPSPAPSPAQRATSAPSSAFSDGNSTPSRVKGTTTFFDASSVSGTGTPLSETGKKISFGFKR